MGSKEEIENLLKSFNNFFTLDGKERKEVARLFKSRTYRRRSLLLNEGDICNHYTFVVSGCFRMYAVDGKGKEHNLQFATENKWIMDFQSFYERKPSKLYIEAVESCEVLQITNEDLLYLYTHYHRFDRNFRIIIERKYIEFQNRILETISVPADERYENFMKQYPELIQRLPNTQIASYLGITPEFLSKLRKQIILKSQKTK